MSTVLLLNRISNEYDHNSAINKFININYLKDYVDEFLESPKEIFKKNVIKNNSLIIAAIDFWTLKILDLLVEIRDQYAENSILYDLWDSRYVSEKIIISLNKPSIDSNGNLKQFNINWEYVNTQDYLNWLLSIYQDIKIRKKYSDIDDKIISNYNNDINIIINNDDYYDRIYTCYYHS